MLVKIEGSTVVAHSGGLSLPPTEGSGANGRVYSGRTLRRLANDGRVDDLAALGIGVALDMAVPEGKRIVGAWRLELVNGQPMRVWDVEDIETVEDES